MAAPRVRGSIIGALVTSGLVLAPVAPALAFSTDGPGGIAPNPSVTETTASVKDPTVTPKARQSKAYRKSVSLATWVSAPKAKAVAKRESGGNCKAVSPTGLYRGKWQMSAAFWAGYGGKKFATRANLATCHEQDRVAYRGWLASWWRPWGG